MTDLSARNRRNKRKGSQWETDLREGLRGLGFDVESLRLAGTEDEGDMVVRLNGGYLVIEAKNAKFEPATFVREAKVERLNFAKHRGLDPELVTSLAVVKARGKNWRQAYVLTTLEDYLGLDAQ
ncbi:hypothetical protein ASD97_10210 [Streptomyces sp. Root63]|uniref:hypothetical protein n=1 Tax=unclassified Streptomyces TaxID=2593676 RepID=UPI0006F4DCFD|nr:MULTISPECIES: hypothetical protein [unclassified Streptomyces]KQX36966.1 hypothetical protein ASD29_07020 [Streptomyces sp. Root1295]KRA43972.1 hypothetical protein ASD97_10210 [Streptomyces sp. Root63]